jgi:hypothetical protein
MSLVKMIDAQWLKSLIDALLTDGDKSLLFNYKS